MQTEAGGRSARAGAWLRYAATGLAATAILAWLLGAALGGAAERAVWLAAVLALALQLVAFAALVWVRRNPTLFMAGWLGGMVLRFGALAAVGFWVTRYSDLPAEPMLLSLVGFMFLLLLLEPIFLQRGLRTA